LKLSILSLHECSQSDLESCRQERFKCTVAFCADIVLIMRPSFAAFVTDTDQTQLPPPQSLSDHWKARAPRVSSSNESIILHVDVSIAVFCSIPLSWEVGRVKVMVGSFGGLLDLSSSTLPDRTRPHVPRPRPHSSRPRQGQGLSA